MTTWSKGKRVAYRREFLRSVGAFTGWMPFARGTVLSTSPLGTDACLVCVEWDTGETLSVLSDNLVSEDRLHLERN